ncbi:hypothetical protein GOBAR_AA35725 [Gossypium barbadense]|uniref:Uncharacterized protein n=1 Tax=Gossypium barbadense TaxID=3634 RepID=A0A2P5W1P8_GOSBA|nr:hypothetical protein GOBAR_AA35725 [Gossypium barbadense]
MVVRKGKNEVGQNDPKMEISLKNLHKPCSNNNKGPIYEERRLQIEELDEWRIHKSRTLDKLKLSQDELNTSPNQLKVGDKVLLDAANPRITTSEPNEEIPFTVLNIFPYGTVKVIQTKFGTFKLNTTRLKPYIDKVDSRDEEWQKKFSPTRDAISFHGRATWPWVKLPKYHGRGTCPCFGSVEKPVNVAQAFDTPMPIPMVDTVTRTRACAYIHSKYVKNGSKMYMDAV